MIYTQREAERGNKKEKGGDERGKKEKGRKREIVWVARWCSGPDLKKWHVLEKLSFFLRCVHTLVCDREYVCVCVTFP